MSAAERRGKGKWRRCELCGAAGRVYCEADEAVLCWACDAQVHGANLLVERHSRALLCRGCEAPTPWRAEGPRLGHTASLCERCLRLLGDEEEEGEEDEGESQVVLWATEAAAASSTSASSRESAAVDGANAAECTKYDVPCLTCHRTSCHQRSAHHVTVDEEATFPRDKACSLSSRHRKRSLTDFLGTGPAQPESIPPSRNCSNAAVVPK